MSKAETKMAAEAILLELPSVVGVNVREDVFGHPREIHLLVAPGPSPRHLARDIRDLLEERLGVPVDQRIISIAQIASGATLPRRFDRPAETPAETPAEAADAPRSAEEGTATTTAPATRGAAPAARPLDSDAAVRLRFLGMDMERSGNRISAQVRLQCGAAMASGEATELDSPLARVRVGAGALLQAATRLCDGRGRFDLEDASVVRAFGRQIVLVNVLAHAAAAGRRPISLPGAQPIEDAPEIAAALATLKAVNRIAGLILREGAADR
jgi:hypothetical protein